MTDEEWAAVLRLRKTLWPYAGSLSPETRAEWRGALEHIAVLHIAQALRDHNRASQFAPGLADWLRASEAALRASERGTALARLEEMHKEERTEGGKRAAKIALSLVLDEVPLAQHDAAWAERKAWTDEQLDAAIKIAKVKHKTPNLAKVLMESMVGRVCR